MATGTTTVVLVPGAPGSQLLWTDPGNPNSGSQLIWPGTAEDLGPEGYRWNAQLLSDSVQPDGLIMTALCDLCPIYGPLAEKLESWGFKLAGGTLVLCDYDWRASAADAAKRLAQKIDLINQKNPAASITILAHSMGGLVSRYYLESGNWKPQNIAQLIMMGTPNRGAPDALITRMGADNVDFLSAAEVLKLADDPGFPALYQLFPPPGDTFAFDSSNSNQAIDIYAPANPLGLTKTNVDSAVAFFGSLDPSKRGNITYFCFAGRGHPTYTNVFLTSAQGQPYQVDTDNTQPTDMAGDGTVPFLSAALTGVPSAEVSGKHMTIFQDDDLLTALASMLGRPAMAAQIAPRVQVMLSKKMVHRGDTAHLVVKFPQQPEKIGGELRVEKLDAKGLVTRVVSRQKIGRESKVIGHLPMAISVPAASGNYRVSFQRTGRSQPESHDIFFVRPAPKTLQRIKAKTRKSAAVLKPQPGSHGGPLRSMRARKSRVHGGQASAGTYRTQPR
jgi:pimeloyl-ACP methyl ester carboxylesterase